MSYKLLLPALRQYRHNNSNVLIFGYNMKETERIVAELESAAKIAAHWMKDWLDQHCCECEYGHTCGRNERQKELDQILAAISIGDK